MEQKKGNERFGLSRRSFLKGGLAIGGVASLGVLPLTSCSQAPSGTEKPADAGDKPAENPNPGTAVDWLGQEPEISDSDVSETLETDILVVGAGMAGTFAACHAAEAGASVLLIEAQENGHGIRSSSIAAVGSRYQIAQGVEINKEDIVNDFVNYALNICDINLIRDWVDNSAEAVDWLGDILEANDFGYLLEWNMPPKGRYADWPTGHGLITPEGTVAKEIEVQAVMIHHFEAAGGQYRNLTPMKKLIQENGAIVGAYAENEDGDIIRINASKAVVVATGGYVNNQEMYEARQAGLEKSFVGPLNTGTIFGDGIKACLWAGAHLDDFPTTMVFDRGVVRPEEELGFGFGGQEFVHFIFATQPFLKVDKTGRRLTNEASPYDYILHAAKNSPGRAWYSIWDSGWEKDVVRFHTIGCSTMLDREGGNALYSPRIEGTQAQIEDMVESGHCIKADTLEELAAGLLIEDVELFKAEVEAYNHAFEAQYDERFGKDPYRLSSINEPPFYGVKVGGEPLCTLDGIVINDQYQALDDENRPIPGLYLLGNDSGCYYNHTYPNLAAGANAGRCAASGMILGRRLASI